MGKNLTAEEIAQFAMLQAEKDQAFEEIQQAAAALVKDEDTPSETSPFRKVLDRYSAASDNLVHWHAKRTLMAGPTALINLITGSKRKDPNE